MFTVSISGFGRLARHHSGLFWGYLHRVPAVIAGELFFKRGETIRGYKLLYRDGGVRPTIVVNLPSDRSNDGRERAAAERIGELFSAALGQPPIIRFVHRLESLSAVIG